MKTHIIHILTIFLLFSGAIAAQDFNQYQPVVCKGDIPREYITSSTEKYKRDIEKIEKGDLQRKEEKSRKRFALETHFVLDDLLQSGMVLFNDELSQYLNEVLAILPQQPVKSGKNKIEVYTLRSTAVNAFATDRGHIFVTLGLLAQLENEAQLAYILAHELSHVENGHSMELFLESEEISQRSGNRKVLRRSVFNDDALAKCTFSKELETEADKQGLASFLKTKYSIATLNTVYDVLKYSYLPFDDVPFERSVFQSQHYRFPESYWLEKVKPISDEHEYLDNKLSTHPSIGERRRALRAALNDFEDEGRSNYIVSENRFKSVRQIARFELPMLHLHDDELPEAIYTAYLLLREYPESAYLKKCLVKALYLHTKFLNSEDYTTDITHNDMEGEAQQVHHFLDKIPAKEAILLALRHAWQLQQEYPKDQELQPIVADLFVELGEKYKSLSEFSGKPEPSEITAPPVVDSTKTESKDLSKYEKIRQQQSKENTPGGTEYWRFAFAEFLTDTAFAAQYEKGLAEGKERQEEKDFYESAKGKKWLKKQRKKEDKHGVRLGIDKVVVVNPFFLKLDVRKENAVQYIKTEMGQVNMRELIETAAKPSGLDVVMLDISNLKTSQTDQFNDIRFLNEWFSEQVNHYDLTLTPGSNQALVNAIAEKYGTDYFLWTGVVSLREKNAGAVWKIMAGLVLYPALPFAIYDAVRPYHEMLHYSILFDVRTGKRQVIKFDFYKKNDTDGLVKAHLYDAFRQIKLSDK